MYITTKSTEADMWLRKNITAFASIYGAVHCVDRYGGSQCSTAITDVDVTPEVMG